MHLQVITYYFHQNVLPVAKKPKGEPSSINITWHAIPSSWIRSTSISQQVMNKQDG